MCVCVSMKNERVCVCVRACVRACVCVRVFGCVWFVTECVGGCGCERVGVLVIVTEFIRAMRISFECESWGWCGRGGGGRENEKERGGWRWGVGCWWVGGGVEECCLHVTTVWLVSTLSDKAQDNLCTAQRGKKAGS